MNEHLILQQKTIKHNNGDTIWSKSYGEEGTGYSVQQTTDSGYIIAGHTYSFLTENDVCLIKTDVDGDTLWTKSFGETQKDEYGYSVQQTSDSGYIIAGYTYSFGRGNSDVYLIKTDPVGDTLWTKTFGGSDDDGGRSRARGGRECFPYCI